MYRAKVPVLWPVPIWREVEMAKLLIQTFAQLVITSAYTAGIVALSPHLGYWLVVVGPMALVAVAVLVAMMGD